MARTPARAVTAPGDRAAVLEAGLDDVRRSPADGGRVELLVRRPAVDEREEVAEAVLDVGEGLVGDTWSVRPEGPGGAPDPECQVTIMNARAALLVAGSPDRRALAGDQIYVDLDLGVDNLPPGTRLRLGTAVVEISDQPHLGCGKFAARFGREALRFVNSRTGRSLRLRGVNARVVAGGVVRVGDRAEKLDGGVPG